jgi:hypothetical protein
MPECSIKQIVLAFTIIVTLPLRPRNFVWEYWTSNCLTARRKASANPANVRRLLITTLPIDSVAAVLKVVDTYVARWPIEVYFRVYKSGCRVEEIQLETNDRLKTCLLFYKVVAWRLMFLTFLGRECPDLPADVMFAEAEWKPVGKIVLKEPLPESAPTLDEFMPLLPVGRIQPPPQRQPARPTSNLGRHSPDDRLRPRLASLRTRKQPTVTCV